MSTRPLTELEEFRMPPNTAARLVLSCIALLISASIAPAADKLAVFVTIAPQKYFVQRIGRDRVDIHVMVPAGSDPHTFEPKPQQMVAMAEAKLYFAIGIDFEEAWLKKIISTNSRIMIVHTDHGIRKIPMRTGHDLHDFGQEEKMPREGRETAAETGRREVEDHLVQGRPDPHIWLSPPLVKIQAHTILSALQEIDPINRSFYEANYRKFISELEILDADLKDVFSGRSGLNFVVLHPSWGYFADRYGLVQIPIEIEGKNPTFFQLKELIARARTNGVKVVFVQPQFSSKSAKLIAKEIGAEVAFVDPLAENWMANLREVAAKFKAALK